MTGKDLFLALGTIDESFYREAEVEPQRHRHSLTVAALIAALLLLAGCGYMVLSGTQWFDSYFRGQKKQPLSQGQKDYIAQGITEFGQSITVDGYTVTLEYAIAEARVAYLKLRLDGPKKMNDWTYFHSPRLENDQGFEPYFYKKGGTPLEPSGYWGGHWDIQASGRTLSILIRMDQSSNPNKPPFEAGVPYILHLVNLTEHNFGEDPVLLSKGPWDFEIVFDHLNDNTLELVTEPIHVSMIGVELELTSLKLRTMGAEMTFVPENPDDIRTMAVLAKSHVILKDGTSVELHPTNFNPKGTLALALDSPIDLEEIDHFELRDGTRIEVPR